MFSKKYGQDSSIKGQHAEMHALFDDMEFVLQHGDQAQKNVFRSLLKELFSRVEFDMSLICKQMGVEPEQLADAIVSKGFRQSPEWEALIAKRDRIFHEDRMRRKEERRSARKGLRLRKKGNRQRVRGDL